MSSYNKQKEATNLQNGSLPLSWIRTQYLRDFPWPDSRQSFQLYFQHILVWTGYSSNCCSISQISCFPTSMLLLLQTLLQQKSPLHGTYLSHKRSHTIRWPFVPGFFYLVYFQSSSTLQHVSERHSFLRPNTIPVYEYTTPCLSNHLLTAIWVLSIFC